MCHCVRTSKRSATLLEVIFEEGGGKDFQAQGALAPIGVHRCLTRFLNIEFEYLTRLLQVNTEVDI